MNKIYLFLSKNYLIIVLILIAFFIRIINIDFPAFTADEARIAFRGYTLATTGKDELGRSFPLVLNSIEDYQLPIVSYLTALGELIFGKTEFGARIPFIIIGIMLVFLMHQMAKIFSSNKILWLIVASLIAFSPPLIFLSRIPNETIVLTFIFTLLFYLLVKTKNLFLIFLTMLVALLTSKQAWFALLPFVLFTLCFYSKHLIKKERLILITIMGILILLTFTAFLAIPQAKRSLFEHNFSLFSSVTIHNGINQLRGQGLQADWPPLLDRLLFNKGQYILVGFLQWLSHLNPAIYFGNFDQTGLMNYSYIGAWPKILLIPFSIGLFVLVKGKERIRQLILTYFLLLTFPAFFVYPNLSLDLTVLILPFMALVILFGLEKLNKKITIVVISLAILELMANILFFIPEYKNTTNIRPVWIKEIVSDAFKKSKLTKTAISDDLVPDIVPYIEWYTDVNVQAGYEKVAWPYKFRQYQLGNIKIIASQDNFSSCGNDEKLAAFLGKRDFNKIKELNTNTIKAYQDINNQDRVYFIEGVCLR